MIHSFVFLWLHLYGEAFNTGVKWVAMICCLAFYLLCPVMFASCSLDVYDH